MKHLLILQTIKKIIRTFPSEFKRKGVWVMLLLFLNSFLDLLGLTAVLPLFLVILEDNAIEKYALLGKVYHLFNFQSENGFIFFLCLSILSIVIFKNFISLVISAYQGKFSFSLQKFYSVKLFKKYYAKGFMFFKNTNSNYITRDINGVPNAFAMNIVLPTILVLNELVILALIFVGLLIYDIKIIALLAIILIPTFFIFYSLTRKKIQAIAEKLHRLSPRISKILFESIFGYTDVKISNSENQFFDKYDSLQSENVKLLTRNHVFKLAPTKVIESTLFLGVIVITLYGIFLLGDKKALTALIGVFVLAAYRVLPSINRIMISLMSIKAYQYTFDVIERIKEPDYEAAQSDESIPFRDSIEMCDISFKYPDSDEWILRNFNLTIKKGEVLGIIGRSGSGKTTLINLLLKFFNPQSGRLLVDDLELGNSLAKSWRNLVGYVQQDVYILDGTIAENIAFGQSEEQIDFDHLLKCAYRASLQDFIKGLPKGIHTGIGERGSQLSGGQKQRIGIARALYYGANVLLFDEATSALDTETEREVTEAINNLNDGNLTILIVAHRLTTLKHCNRIIELENGKIKRTENYSELIKELI